MTGEIPVDDGPAGQSAEADAEKNVSPVPLTATPLALFLGFASIAVVGFGGVMPWVRWLLVEKRRWCNDDEFLNLFALSNFLPGGNVVNIAILVGSRLGGFAGSVAALAGLVVPPAILVCGVAGLYRSFGHLPAVQSMIHAAAAAAAGLIVAMGVKMVYPLRKSPRALAFVAIVLIASVGFRVPLVWMLCLILPASLAAAHWMRK
jgi:chromate transporter